MTDLSKLASQMRQASAAGRPFMMPLMRLGELGALLNLLGDD